MAVLYLLEQNTILRKSGKRLLFCHKPPGASSKPGVRERDILIDLPCEDVDQVMLFGNVQMTTQVMHQLLYHGIETAVFSYHGKLLGQLTPPAGKNIPLRLAQFDKYHDEKFRLHYAKTIVEYKITYSLDQLRLYEYNHPGTFSKADIKTIEQIADKIKTAEKCESLLGLEGAASAQYFTLLAKMLPQKWQFDSRSRRPPKDPANAVLSFGYTIVGSELRSLLDGVGLDPFLGYYHEIAYGRPSLALDLLELFRHSLVDKLMLRLFNLRILGEDDFVPAGKGGIYLSSSGKVKFFQQYEDMVGSYKGEIAGKQRRGIYRRVFQTQVANLVKTISHDETFKIEKA